MKFHTHTLRSLALLTGVSSLTRAFSVGRPSSAAFLRTANPHFAVADPNLSPFRTWTFDTPCASMAWNSLPSATISTTLTLNETSDLILLGVHNKTLTGLAKSIDEQLQGAFTEMVQKKTFKGKVGNTTPMIQVFVNGKNTKYALVGLGDDGSKIGVAMAKFITEDIVTCSMILPDPPTDTILTDLTSSFLASLYSDNRYRTGDNIKQPAGNLTSVELVIPEVITDTASEAISTGTSIASGMVLAKDIVNAPHNILNSESLAETAKRIAEEVSTLSCRILNKQDCEERGMGAFLGVARGSETQPQFIHLTYTPPPGDDATETVKVGIIGKGLLFDTGGYNIKGSMMELMKFDCGGAAAVLGAAYAIGQLAPKGVEAHFIVAACENMINERAMVPSDVLTASNGKTIEIVNTDAEGRLTLADALVYADKEVGCGKIIELSTLTGACMISLGKGMAGVWTSNDDLATEIEECSKATGDKTWRMPLEDSYNKQLESKIADLTNCGTKYGGAITAALFLQHFVDKEKPFGHIDIAGPVWDDKTGATGFGAKLVTAWVTKQGK